VAAVVALLTAVAGGLVAGTMPGSAAAYAATGNPGDASRMMLVLDASGSMAEPASGGGTKIAAAKSALGTVIDQLPDPAEVGLRVYGSQVYSRTDPGACTDSELVVPPGTGNRDDLRAAVDSYEPYGETPIGHALREAGDDLGSEGQRSIVLVSDGEPTCPPDPCQVAAELAKKGVDVRVDVVGLDVDGPAEQALRCIADKGKGTYYDVTSAEELVQALQTLATRAVRPYQASGEPVTGTPEPAGAPVIGAGSYVDQLGAPGTPAGVRHYTVERTIPGSTLTVSGSVQTPSFTRKGAGAQDWDGLGLEVFGPGGESCGSGPAYFDGAADSPFVTSSATVEEACADLDQVTVAVTRERRAEARPVPLELTVVEEPPLAETGELPEGARGDAAWQQPTGQPTASVVGGSSFATAEPIGPGAYRGTLVPNEVQVFSVDLAWGQQLAGTLTIQRPTGQLAEAAPVTGAAPFSLQIFGPARAPANAPTDQGPDSTATFRYNQGGQVGGTTFPVRYLNRESIDDEAVAASTAGTYSVVVSLADPQAEVSYEVPFVLRVGVTGEVTEPPAYAGESDPASPTADASDSSTPSASPDDGGSDATDAPAEAAGDEAAQGLPGWLAGGAGVVLVAALAGGAWWLRRRRA